MQVLLISAVAALLAAQAPPVAFEVASIRPSDSEATANRGGVQITQSQVRAVGLALRVYLGVAYRLPTDRIIGPDWLGSTRFDLQAKLPDGGRGDQIPEMLQTLLAERFKLRAHRENRDTPVYVLEVVNGVFTLERVPADRDAGPAGGLEAGGGGSAQGITISLGRGSSWSLVPGRFEGRKLSMAMLAQVMTNFAGRPVVDKTGVDGMFDISFPVAEQDFRAMLMRAGQANGAPLPPQALQFLDAYPVDTVFESFRKIGLKVEQRREPLEMLVVDSMERTPTDN
jgi:uncharacterized protein (TIGR03435 family)